MAEDWVKRYTNTGILGLFTGAVCLFTVASLEWDPQRSPIFTIAGIVSLCIAVERAFRADTEAKKGGGLE